MGLAWMLAGQAILVTWRLGTKQLGLKSRNLRGAGETWQSWGRYRFGMMKYVQLLFYHYLQHMLMENKYIWTRYD